MSVSAVFLFFHPRLFLYVPFWHLWMECFSCWSVGVGGMCVRCTPVASDAHSLPKTTGCLFTGVLYVNRGLVRVSAYQRVHCILQGCVLGPLLLFLQTCHKKRCQGGRTNLSVLSVRWRPTVPRFEREGHMEKMLTCCLFVVEISYRWLFCSVKWWGWINDGRILGELSL